MVATAAGLGSGSGSDSGSDSGSAVPPPLPLLTWSVSGTGQMDDFVRSFLTVAAMPE